MKRGVLLALAACWTSTLSAQIATSPPTTVVGQITVTTKGMSTIPALTLGRPAALTYLFVRRGAFSLEPEYRSELDGTPWAFLVWGRYRVQRERWTLGISAHPAFNFRPSTVTLNGATREMIVVHRYLVGELTPTYAVSRYASVGATYLYLHGVENDVVRHTHFVALRSAETMPLSGRFALRFAPQLYYLYMGHDGGTYAHGVLTISRQGWPISLSTAGSDPIHTTIAAGKEFVWNVSANYAIQ